MMTDSLPHFSVDTRHVLRTAGKVATFVAFALSLSLAVLL